MFRSAGVPLTVLHEGWPTQLPAEPPKDVDVVTVGDNRWAAVTRKALEGFGGSWRELPALNNAQLVSEIGRGRVFVHCPRIEGSLTTRRGGASKGTYCVDHCRRTASRSASTTPRVARWRTALRTYRPSSTGSSATACAVRQHLARASARAETGWADYVERVGDAIAAVEAEAERKKTARPSLRAADALKRLVRGGGCSVGAEHRFALRSRRVPARVGEAACDDLSGAQRPLDRVGERLGAIRIGPERDRAARVVERRVGRGDDWRAGRHRLDHRHAEPLPARRIDEDLGAAVERLELLVG